MAPFYTVEEEFSRRLAQISAHGLGLSVDVYSPDLISLLGALCRRQLQPGYLEIFRAAPAVLASIRRRATGGLLTYHGEGLWLTQPESAGSSLFEKEICETARHLRGLDSAWLNHECAAKSIAGYSFGTYVPPLYTEQSAEVVAENTRLMQDLLDRHCRLPGGGTPLVLLEMPPLSYFVAGTVAIPTFFRLVTQQAACGLVLDIGHLWTVYRYSKAKRATSLMQFVDDFLDQFPLERVVEIHVAGLAVHESNAAAHSSPCDLRQSDCLPAWIDTHAAPIPPILYEVLDKVLSRPHLTNLRGLALEVDTKPIELIVDEFARFSDRYASVIPRMKNDQPAVRENGGLSLPRMPVSSAIKHELGAAYDRYARVITGRAEPEGPEWDDPAACAEDLDTYRSAYLPHEILSWGGEVEAMFPDTWCRLSEQGVPLSRFVAFWFSRPRPVAAPYDFFLVKIERFVEFIRQEAPEWAEMAEREADSLRRGYDLANQPSLQAVGERA